MKKRKTDADITVDPKGDFMWTCGRRGEKWEPIKLRRLSVGGLGAGIAPELPPQSERPSLSQIQRECDDRNAGKAVALWQFTKRPLSKPPIPPLEQAP